MEIEEIEISKIVENPHQVREGYDKESMDTLIRSIKERGLLSPIQVLKDNDKYFVICGHRRLQAFKKLKKKTIPAIVKKRQKKKELIIDLIHENLIRDDLTPLEKAKSIHLLISQIKNTKGDVDSMISLINILRNWKRRGYTEDRRERTKLFKDDDVYNLQKILKSINICENNCAMYLSLLKLPSKMSRNIVHNAKMRVEGKIVLKQAEQLARVKDNAFQDYLFERCLNGLTAKGLQALVDRHIEQVVKGEWKGISKKTYNSVATMFKSSINKLEELSKSCNILSGKIASFKVDTLIKLDETLEKEKFIASILSLRKDLMLLKGRIDEKLKNKGYVAVSEKVSPFEVALNFNDKKGHFRFTLPMEVIKQLGYKKDKIFVKLKIAEIHK